MWPATHEVKLISLTPQDEAAKIKRRLIIDFLKKYVHEMKNNRIPFCYETGQTFLVLVWLILLQFQSLCGLNVKEKHYFFPQIQHTDISALCESADRCISLQSNLPFGRHSLHSSVPLHESSSQRDESYFGFRSWSSSRPQVEIVNGLLTCNIKCMLYFLLYLKMKHGPEFLENRFEICSVYRCVMSFNSLEKYFFNLKKLKI